MAYQRETRGTERVEMVLFADLSCKDKSLQKSDYNIQTKERGMKQQGIPYAEDERKDSKHDVKESYVRYAGATIERD